MSERDPVPMAANLGAFPAPDPNAPRIEHDLRASVRAQREAKVAEFCPAEFRQEIDRKLLPNQKAWDDANLWGGDFPGVWLWSLETGRAKTRMLWHKFKTFHVEQGRTVIRVNGVNLGEEYHDARRRGRTAEFYRFAGRGAVVMLDDLDKMELPRVGAGFSAADEAMQNARMVRELFDVFYEDRVPVLVTANRAIDWFRERVGESAARRMRAVCREVAF